MDYIKQSNMPLRYQKDFKLIACEQDLTKFDILNDIKSDIVNFVNNGKNLYIYSSITGNGKTSWACKLGKAYLDYAKNYSFKYNCPLFFINVTSLLNMKKSAMDVNNESAKNNIRNYEKNIIAAPLVIWDDIGVKYLSEYDKEYLYLLLDYRISNMKSNIYTSNLMPESMEPIVGPRLYSRIINSSYKICFEGGDRRSTTEACLF